VAALLLRDGRDGDGRDGRRRDPYPVLVVWNIPGVAGGPLPLPSLWKRRTSWGMDRTGGTLLHTRTKRDAREVCRCPPTDGVVYGAMECWNVWNECVSVENVVGGMDV